MSVVKINAISVPEGAGPELESRFAARAGAVAFVLPSASTLHGERHRACGYGTRIARPATRPCSRSSNAFW